MERSFEDQAAGTGTKHHLRPRATALMSLGALLAAMLPCQAGTFASELAELSLEELGNIRITSVSKRDERLGDAAASVYVISAADIRLAGARSLPEALRLAPNLHVAQASSTGYAISARGLNGSNNSAPNKLLVLIDGRSVYTPLFSGVFWDVQDVVIEDIERIEVISGPGGTLWGVNAVNGVINVITRSAADTQGTLLVAATGSQDSDYAFRHGGALGTGAYRVYGKYVDRAHTSTEADLPINDAGHLSQVGLRMDWGGSSDRLSVHANAYRGAQGQPAPGAIAILGADIALGDVVVSGSNLTARWERPLTSGASFSVQAYYDHTERAIPPMFAETLDIFDVELQHRIAPLGRHSLVWGANYRSSADRITNSAYFAFLPARVEQEWASVFVQDEVRLTDHLQLTLGTRFERNDYTGVETLPNARLAWQPSPRHMVWTAASRVVRAPSRLDRDAYVPGVPPFLLDGGPAVRSEVANVYELGYRGQLSPTLTYSATAFHADYDDLRTQEIAPSYTFVLFGSGMQGKATGVEMWATYQPLPAWRVDAGFTALHETLWLKPGSNDVAAPDAAGHDPSHTWQLRSSWDIDDARDVGIGIRHVAALARHAIPAYTAVDARVAWRLSPELELSVSGRNLFGRHAEYGPLATRSEIAPSMLVRLAWRR